MRWMTALGGLVLVLGAGCLNVFGDCHCQNTEDARFPGVFAAAGAHGGTPSARGFFAHECPDNVCSVTMPSTGGSVVTLSALHNNTVTFSDPTGQQRFVNLVDVGRTALRQLHVREPDWPLDWPAGSCTTHGSGPAQCRWMASLPRASLAPLRAAALANGTPLTVGSGEGLDTWSYQAGAWSIFEAYAVVEARQDVAGGFHVQLYAGAHDMAEFTVTANDGHDVGRGEARAAIASLLSSWQLDPAPAANVTFR